VNLSFLENGAAMAPGDLRSWLAEVDRRGALVRVPRAHWNLEIGGITEVNNREGEHNALLFEDIPDCETGRVLTCATSNLASLTATLRTNAQTKRDLVEYLRGGRITAWADAAREAPFEWIDDGPVFEHRDRGSDIDLFRFPVPLWHSHDGGRYIGTGCAVITMDPDTGSYNAGAYRCMVAGKDRVTVVMGSASRHGKQHHLKYQRRNEPCPMVISFGHDPLIALLAGIELPEGVFEIDVAGVIANQRAQMCRGPITGLPIPAHAELVAEGWLTDEMADEGPFGEFTGYYAGAREPRPVMRIEALYYRENPIILGSPPGRPPHDFSHQWSILRSALLQDQLALAGVPGVTAVWADEVGGGRLLITVAIKQRYPGHAKQAAAIASQCGAGAYFGRYVIVVDDDIDPTDLRDVMWAVATRSDPERDIDILRNTWGSPVDPLREVMGRKADFNSRGLIDACRPFEYLDTFPPTAASTPEELGVIRKKWSTIWHPETVSVSDIRLRSD
jgi:UbiD family decarboxylase